LSEAVDQPRVGKPDADDRIEKSRRRPTLDSNYPFRGSRP
jgi:hypothetical protein